MPPRLGPVRIAGQRRFDTVESPVGAPFGGGGRTFENFIVAPPTVRSYPVAFITEGEILAVRWAVPVGSIAVQFKHNGSVIYSDTVAGTGGHTFDTPIAAADNDTISPEITAIFSGASEATMSYLVTV